MYEWITSGLFAICWLVVIIEIVIPRISALKIYSKIVQLFFIIGFLSIISYPMLSDIKNIWGFTWFHFCSLGVMANLYFLLRAMNRDAHKSIQRLHMLGCAICLIGILFSPWKP